MIRLTLHDAERDPEGILVESRGSVPRVELIEEEGGKSGLVHARRMRLAI